MRRAWLVIGFLWGFLVVVLCGSAAMAQDRWVQIEALPTLAEGEARARAYGGAFPNVAGFELTSGWYAIVLGPFAPDEAARQLRLLIADRMIPADSYIPENSRLVRKFWPVGMTSRPTPDATEGAGQSPGTPEPEPLAVVPEPEPEPDETPRQARASEGALLPEERERLQTALQWAGYYAGKIDGAIGAGTRNSMAAWQASKGYDETGVLTKRQRAELVDDYQSEIASIGLGTVKEEKAGIEIAIPGRLVQFGHYEPPFVHYDERDGSGYRVVLISQQGDEATLFGLFDIMQTLEIVPLDGERTRQRASFVLTGKNETVQSYTEAKLEGGFIKGFTLVWNPNDGARAIKVLEAMKASFKPIGDRALDDSLGEPLGASKDALLAGLEIRRPVRSRSGFYIAVDGTVLTTSEAVEECGRITLDGTQEATVEAVDDVVGLAVLTPATPLAPRAVAGFRTAPLRRGAEVAVAGYPYEDALDAPVVTFGTFEDSQGLDGEEDLERLAMKSLPGDAGGAVMDTTGAVVGMLLPKVGDSGRVLPEDVVFARDAGALAEALSLRGLSPIAADRTGSMAAEDLAAYGRSMTVLVSCWE